MTDIAVVIGGHTVTGDVQYMMFQADDLSGARTCEIIILNEGNEWDNDFAIKDAIDVNIDSAAFWDGYVDDVEPFKHPNFIDLPMVKIRGIDYGFDLTKLFIDKDYETQQIDNIIDDALSTASSEITYGGGVASPEAAINFKRKYLGDGIRELCKDANWTFYVDGSKALHLFAIGAATEYLDGGGGRADVDLDSVAGSLMNNILDWKEGEKWGSKLWNYVEITAGFVQDHYTDENAADFTAGTNTTVTDVSAANGDVKFTDWWRGRGGIKALRDTNNGTLLITLDFSGTRYEYSTLDLTVNSIIQYLLFCGFNEASGNNKRLRFRLEDADGEIIEFRKHLRYFDPAAPHDRTDNLTNGEWYKVTVPVGTVQAIAAYGSGGVPGWEYVTNTSSFDWANVDKLHWRSPASIATNGYIILDDLTIPTIEAKAIDQDATSITAYKKRMLTRHRPDIKSQKELDVLGASLLSKHKDPPQTLDLLLIGNTDIKFTGQSLDVNAPPYGIASDTKYRIQHIQHKITLKGQGPVRDYEYTTRVRLIEDQVGGASQKTSPSDFIDPWNWSVIDSQNMAKQQEEWQTADVYADPWFMWQTGIIVATGTSFPDNPADGDGFFRTDLGETYKYDQGNTRWVAQGYVNDATTGVTADSETTGITADRETSGVTADREQAAMTADRETSGVVSDTAPDRTIPDRQVIEQTNIAISSSFTTIADWNTPTDNSEEMYLYVSIKPRDATPADLFIKVLVGATNYPSNIGVKIDAGLQNQPQNINFLIPRNTNSIRVRVQAKHTTVTENWDTRCEYQLHDAHSHGITEPNAGGGHDTSMSEPNAGQGHDTGITEPQSGTGHDTGLTDTGHGTAINDGGHGAGEAADGHNDFRP